MEISKTGLDFIKKQEGEVLTAYRDSAGVWTIGVGHTKTARRGMTITSAESSELLNKDLDEAEKAVNRVIKVAINQNQFDALVSLTFNIGTDALAQSSLVRYLNIKNYVEAGKRFLLWNKITKVIKGRKVAIELKGLTKRREREKALFETK